MQLLAMLMKTNIAALLLNALNGTPTLLSSRWHLPHHTYQDFKPLRAHGQPLAFSCTALCKVTPPDLCQQPQIIIAYISWMADGGEPRRRDLYPSTHASAVVQECSAKVQPQRLTLKVRP